MTQPSRGHASHCRFLASAQVLKGIRALAHDADTHAEIMDKAGACILRAARQRSGRGHAAVPTRQDALQLLCLMCRSRDGAVSIFWHRALECLVAEVQALGAGGGAGQAELQPGAIRILEAVTRLVSTDMVRVRLNVGLRRLVPSTPAPAPPHGDVHEPQVTQHVTQLDGLAAHFCAGHEPEFCRVEGPMHWSGFGSARPRSVLDELRDYTVVREADRGLQAFAKFRRTSKDQVQAMLMTPRTPNARRASMGAVSTESGGGGGGAAGGGGQFASGMRKPSLPNLANMPSAWAKIQRRASFHVTLPEQRSPASEPRSTRSADGARAAHVTFGSTDFMSTPKPGMNRLGMAMPRRMNRVSTSELDPESAEASEAGLARESPPLDGWESADGEDEARDEDGEPQRERLRLQGRVVVAGLKREATDSTLWVDHALRAQEQGASAVVRGCPKNIDFLRCNDSTDIDLCIPVYTVPWQSYMKLQALVQRPPTQHGASMEPENEIVISVAWERHNRWWAHEQLVPTLWRMLHSVVDARDDKDASAKSVRRLLCTLGGDTSDWVHPPPFVSLRPEVRGLRILSLDGGGVRGLATLEILRAVEAKTGLKVGDMFDMIVGTSVGGMIAMALASKKQSLDQIFAFVKRVPQEVFAKPFENKKLSEYVGDLRAALTAEKYDVKNLVEVLQAYFGSTGSLLESGAQPGALKCCVISAQVRIIFI